MRLYDCMSPQPTDTALIQAVLTGNMVAFTALVERYQQYVFTLVLRYVPTREEAEELAQDVFIKAHRNLAQFRQESRFSTWLYAITHTTCLSYLRKTPLPVQSIEEDTLVILAGKRHNEAAEWSVEQRSQQKLLREAISQLKEEDARLITLYYTAEQSLHEMAAILSLPAATLKVRLHRARTRLRDLLMKKHPGELQNFNER